MGIEGVQVCRLCLAEEEDLINIFNPNGYQGLHLCQIIEELLQMEVSKKDGLPWTICEECISKVKEFKHFKTTCIKAKISFLTMIANRGLVSSSETNAPTWVLQEPVKAFRKRGSGETSRKDSDEVEVVMKEETPALSEDEDPLQEITVERREEDHGGKIKVKDEMGTDKAMLDAESCSKENLFRDDSVCTGVSNVAALSDPLDLISVKKDDDGDDSLLEPVSCNQENVQHIESLDVGALNVVCLPLEMGECPTNEVDIEPKESQTGEETHEGDNLVECYSRVTTVTNVVSVPQPVGDIVDGGSMAGGSAKMCEEIESELREGRNKDITKHFERNTSLSALTGEHSLRTVKMCSAKKEEGLKSGECNTSVLNLNCMMPCERRNLDSHKKQPAGCTALICDQCGVKYSDKKKLLIHVGGHISRNRPSTSVKPSLKSIQSRVTGIQSSKQLKCEMCGKDFKLQRHLTRHYVLHSNLKPFKCETCGKMYKTKNNLLVHSKIHLDSKLFKCDCCGKGFTSKSDLAKHLVIHSGLRPFKCETCGKRFSQKGNLVSHSVTHSASRPFKCDTCGKGFARKFDLDAHMIIHSDFRPYKCDTCGKYFKRKKYLCNHLVIHSVLRPFKCETCGKEFNWRKGLRSHSITHSLLK